MTQPLTPERAEEQWKKHENIKCSCVAYHEPANACIAAASFLEGHKAMREKARRLEEALDFALKHIDFIQRMGLTTHHTKAIPWKEALADFRREAGV